MQPDKKNVHAFSSTIKASARYSLLGHLGTCVGVTLIYLFFYFIMYEIAGSVFTGDGIASLLGSLVTQWILLTLFGLFEYGNASIYISLQYGQDVHYGQVFSGFRENPDKILKIQSVLSSIALLCVLPQAIFGYVTGFATDTDLVVYWVLTALGVLVEIFFSLLFGLSFYILLDYPSEDPFQCLRLSAKMMRGRKARLFYLYLSFIPMGLLCLCSLGIGALWVLPYFNASIAAFYKNCVSGTNR